MGYKKCPRCNLNYIDESENFCRICLIETGKIDNKREDEFDDDLELCPECGENLIRSNELMCSHCMTLYEKTKAPMKDGLLDDYSDADEITDIVDDDMFVSIEELEYTEGENETEDLDENN